MRKFIFQVLGILVVLVIFGSGISMKESETIAAAYYVCKDEINGPYDDFADCVKAHNK